MECTVLDVNLEGQLYLLGDAAAEGAQDFDTWTRRARRRLPDHLSRLRHPELYRSIDRYRRCVNDVNRLLERRGRQADLFLTLADYQDPRYSPLKSGDLLRAAGDPEANPFYPWFARRLADLADKNPPSIAGISLNYVSQALCTFAVIGFIRRRFPGIVIVLGGGLVTSWLRRGIDSNPFRGLVDHCVAGPGEDFLMGLAGVGRCGDPFHRPDYSDFPEGGYLSPGPILPYSASRGCSWRRCTFCPEKTEGGCYAPVPEEQLQADLEALVGQKPPSLVHFLDNTMSPQLLEHLAAHPPGAPWYGFARVSPQLADPDFCRTLKASGCVMLKLGLESGDQGVLDALEKGIRVSVASKVLKTLKGVGIGTYVYLLFGTPVEGPAAARRTLEFAAGHAGVIDFFNLAIFNLPAGSDETASLRVHPFTEGDLSLYVDFEHPEGWGRREIRAFLDKEFRRHPAVAPIVRRMPPYFTSNHAPFMLNCC